MSYLRNPKPISQKGFKRNVEVQEEIVSALHEFAHSQNLVANHFGGKRDGVDMYALRIALERIANAVKLKITEMQ